MKNPFKKEENTQDGRSEMIDVVKGTKTAAMPSPPSVPDYKLMYEQAVEKMANMMPPPPDPYLDYIARRYGAIDNADKLAGMVVSELKEIRQAFRLPPFN